ncbi:MAG: RNase adapter RapZ [Trueperaceae bacterium]|nr:RNase adapter RapZ [Trueperaceae bacterium]
MKALEDLDFFCIDNLPPSFLPQLTTLHDLAVDQGQRVAVAMDVRGGKLFQDLFSALDTLQADGTPHQILFLDSADDILVRRYSETRRRHPLHEGRTLFEQIALERRMLAEVRDRADLVLDTSFMTAHDLKGRLSRMVVGRDVERSMTIDVMSFGFKHGVPLDADNVFDVRFLPNPYYDVVLRPQSGLDADVATYVLDRPEAQDFIADVVGMLRRWIPHYARSGRSRLTVAIGCTGGRHRSVAIAEYIAAQLGDLSDAVGTHHRDLRVTTVERRVPVAEKDDG